MNRPSSFDLNFRVFRSWYCTCNVVFKKKIIRNFLYFHHHFPYFPYLTNSVFLCNFKLFMYLSITILLIKVTSLRYTTLMPAFFPILKTLLKRAFWYHQQLLFRFFFYFLNRSKKFSFHRCLQFRKRKKSAGISYDLFVEI